MAMKAIGGDLGQPRRPAFVKVPAREVLIDLVALYPLPPHLDGKYHPDGLQIRQIHRGVLTEWGISESTGEWFGKVTYTVRARLREDTVTQWVPGWCLKPV